MQFGSQELRRVSLLCRSQIDLLSSLFFRALCSFSQRRVDGSKSHPILIFSRLRRFVSQRCWLLCVKMMCVISALSNGTGSVLKRFTEQVLCSAPVVQHQCRCASLCFSFVHLVILNITWRFKFVFIRHGAGSGYTTIYRRLKVMLFQMGTFFNTNVHL